MHDIATASRTAYDPSGSLDEGSAAGFADGRKPLRAGQIEIALEIDGLARRCETVEMPFVAYLLRVARAAMSEQLGERPRR